MKKIQISSSTHSELIDITSNIQNYLPDGYTGVCYLYIPHTSAAITINEGADPAVQADVLRRLDTIVPWDDPMDDHAEGNSAAHLKAMLVGNDQSVIVQEGQLQLGTWERIFLCEFDGPRTRKLWMQLK